MNVQPICTQDPRSHTMNLPMVVPILVPMSAPMDVPIWIGLILWTFSSVQESPGQTLLEEPIPIAFEL